MGRRFVPMTVLAATLAFAVAAASMAFVLDEPRLWSASVALVVLGGITPMIYAVNARIVPVFSGRDWQSHNLIFGAMGSGIAGAWLTYLGRASGDDLIEQIGALAALAGGVLFLISVVLLFRSPRTERPTPPVPFPEQTAVDRIGTYFMRLASFYLLMGLSIGVMLTFWIPPRGRWDLVWAHAMLVGWFMSMASGVLYHVLPRWTGERWRRPRLIRVHLLTVLFGLPFMVLALAINHRWLFAVAGTLQAVALLLLIWNVIPLARRLPSHSRVGVVGAGCFLAIGVLLGASVAMDPVNHVNLRFTHAQANLFGWGALLVCGVGYYLFPRFTGRPLRWPLLATAQMVLLIAGVLLSATAWWWYLAVDRAAEPLTMAGALTIAASLLTYGVVLGATFYSQSAVPAGITIQSLRTARRPQLRNGPPA